jgi:hypothetical protein
MKNLRRTVLLLLAASAAASLFSCGEARSQAASDTTAAVSQTEGETETTEIADSLPDSDLQGYDFRILEDNADSVQTIYSEGMTGNIVNDAVYSKQTAVEDRFNVKISLAASTIDIKKTVLAGDDSYDMAQHHDVDSGDLSLNGLFVNLLTVPHLDFTKPWWPAATVASMTVCGKMFLVSDNISWFSLGETRVMFFSKSLFDTLGKTYPYASVNDGTWTLDGMAALIKDSYADLNGNGENDADDQYGIVNADYYYGWLEPFNDEPYVKDADGNLSYSFDLEKMSGLVTKFYAILCGGSGYLSDFDTSVKCFGEKRAMFIYETLKIAANNLSAADVVYGILPMPKYDETQDKYYGGCTDRPHSVPITATPNLDTIGIVMEALNAEGYKQVFPAYYEMALKTRYADQSDDANMIDLVHGNVIMAFTYIYGNYSSPYNDMLATLFNVKNPSTDVASYAAKKEKSQTARVEKIMKFYSEG